MPRTFSLLISINFISSSGGVARVARLIAASIQFDKVLSFYGNAKEDNVSYFNKKFLNFSLAFYKSILFDNPARIVFDHIGPASLLKFVPKILLKNKKIVVFLHDEEAWDKVSNRHAWGLEKATHILCNSNYTFTRFIKNNPIYKDKTSICLLGGVPEVVKQSGFKTTNYYKNPRKKYCLFVSRLWKDHRYKGYIELVNAFEILEKEDQRKELSLIIIGRGDDVDFLKELINKSKLDHAIQLLTNVSDEELSTYYKDCVALIFPSIREGFGFVFLEAMYFGKACIGIKNQPAEEIIIDGISGVLLNDNSAFTISKVLKEINENENKFLLMGIEGQKQYFRKFDNHHFKERFLKCIHE